MGQILIISHKYKFIFIKTAKTAGTSVEIALSKFCGSEDVITCLAPEDEQKREDLGYCGSQNFIISKSDYSIRDWSKIIFRDWCRLYFKGWMPAYTSHNSAEYVRNYIGEEVWNSYYKFCIVRNPWDCMISSYYWKNKSEPRQSISEFINSKWLLRAKKVKKNLYTINGRIAVDKVCFYENLEEDLEEVRIRCGLPEKLTLPNAKASFRKDRRSYREILNKEQAEKIRELSSKEIAFFGYEF